MVGSGGDVFRLGWRQLIHQSTHGARHFQLVELKVVVSVIVRKENLLNQYLVIFLIALTLL